MSEVLSETSHSSQHDYFGVIPVLHCISTEVTDSCGECLVMTLTPSVVILNAPQSEAAIRLLWTTLNYSFTYP